MTRLWHSNVLRNARLALPPTWTLAIVGGVYLLAEVFQQLGQAMAAGQFGQFPRGPLWLIGVVAMSPPNFFQDVQAKALCFAAALYAGYRVSAYHPYLRDSYRTWLKTTCWRIGRPLPLGPVTLTLTDVLLLTLVTGLSWHIESLASPFLPLTLFAVFYFLPITFSLFREGPRGWGYAILVGLLGMLLFGRRPVLACLVALPTYVVACHGLRRSLARLDLGEPGWIAKSFVTAQAGRGERSSAQFSSAWPFAYLSPQPPEDGLPRFDAICIALLLSGALFAWIVFLKSSGGSLLPSDRDVADVVGIGWLPCVAVAAIRLFAYCAYYRPPISILGRFAAGRLLIPSYDCGLVPPLLGLFVFWSLAPGFLSLLGIPMVIEIGIRLAIALLVILVPGPTFRNWVLTGECRIAPLRIQ
jgi:hypothetical protein